MGKELIKSDIKLTIGILVSNNIKHIRNVLEALKPLLNAVSSELIVVDTKGEETDGSIAVAREYTDKIYPFVWYTKTDSYKSPHPESYPLPDSLPLSWQPHDLHIHTLYSADPAGQKNCWP